MHAYFPKPSRCKCVLSDGQNRDAVCRMSRFCLRTSRFCLRMSRFCSSNVAILFVNVAILFVKTKMLSSQLCRSVQILKSLNNAENQPTNRERTLQKLANICKSSNFGAHVALPRRRCPARAPRAAGALTFGRRWCRPLPTCSTWKPRERQGDADP